MKAVITMKLVRPRYKRTIVKKTITAKKDYILELVYAFIYERAHKENFIPVEEFSVEVFNTRGRVIEQWRYKPTYRV